MTPNPRQLGQITAASGSLFRQCQRQFEIQGLFSVSLKLCQKQLPPGHAEVTAARQMLGEAYVAAGRFADALSLLKAALAADPDPQGGFLSMRVAVLQVWCGDYAGYEATCRQMQALAVKKHEAYEKERIAKSSCFHPGPDATLKATALQIAQGAVEIGKNGGIFAWCLTALGMSEYRNGRYVEAIDTLTKAAQTAQEYRKDWKLRIQGLAGFYQAMSLYQSGHPDDARRVFSQSESDAQWLLGDEGQPLFKVTNSADFELWHDDLAIWLAYKEAKAVLNETKALKP